MDSILGQVGSRQLVPINRNILVGTVGILGQVGSRQLVPINRNILVWTVYWDRLVPGSLSRLTEIS